MFSQTNGENGDARTLGGPRGRGTGDQIRGFGVSHDGSEAGPEDFLSDEQFQLSAQELRQVLDFVFAFPTNLAPVVGQQVTLRSNSVSVHRIAWLTAAGRAGISCVHETGTTRGLGEARRALAGQWSDGEGVREGERHQRLDAAELANEAGDGGARGLECRECAPDESAWEAHASRGRRRASIR
jgi:hypothetical protein